jgi:hypothetical protein
VGRWVGGRVGYHRRFSKRLQRGAGGEGGREEETKTTTTTTEVKVQVLARGLVFLSE